MYGWVAIPSDLAARGAANIDTKEEKNMRLGNGLTLLAAILILGLTAVASKETPRVELNLRDTSGQRVRIRDLRGKVVVLNFWATWCGPCKAEMPMLVDAEKEYGPRGVVFVAASLDDPKNTSEILAFLKARNVSFSAWLGANGDDLERLEMGPAVPATAFLDSDGHIVARVQGQIRQQELKERLDWLTGSHTGNPPEAVVRHLEK
jgi:thiol-disulfide isomerase/thioredoxin